MKHTISTIPPSRILPAQCLAVLLALLPSGMVMHDGHAAPPTTGIDGGKSASARASGAPAVSAANALSPAPSQPDALPPTSEDKGRKGEDAADTYRELERLAGVLAHIQNSHLSPPETKALVDGAIRGMVSTLDPHSAFLSAVEIQELETKAGAGSMASPGISLARTEITQDGTTFSRLTVVAPSDGSPAQKAGILSGDTVTHIDGIPTAEMPAQKAESLLLGAAGSTVAVGIWRKGFQFPRTLLLERQLPALRTADMSMPDPAIALLRIRRFEEGTGDIVRQGLKDIRGRTPSGRFRGLIIDLRNNPGGRLEEAARVADLFLGGGKVIYRVEDSGGKELESRTAHRSGTEPDYPVMVLVNRGTASAAEVLAGALQDHGRARILGERTFGKGTVQLAFALSDGSALKLTVARCRTPLGREIHGRGISPDVTSSREHGADGSSGRDQVHYSPAQEPGKDAPSPADQDLDLALRLLNRDR